MTSSLDLASLAFRPIDRIAAHVFALLFRTIPGAKHTALCKDGVLGPAYVNFYKKVKSLAKNIPEESVSYAGRVAGLVTGFRIKKRCFNRVLASMFGPILLAIREVRRGT